MSSEEDSAEVLIAEIQARPTLWNPKLGSYKNKNMRDRQYAEVGEILGISKETVASRWKNKKDKYRRELKKVPVLRSGDGANNYKITWPYFEMMSFLKDVMTPAVKSGNLSTCHQSQDGVIDSEMEEDNDTRDTQSSIPSSVFVESPPSISALSKVSEQERPSSVSASSATSQQGKGNRKRLCDVRDEKFLEIENKKLQLLAQNLTNDADKPESEELYFFKSLIPYMEKFNHIEKLQVRNQIQQVVLDKLLDIENSRDATFRQSTKHSDARQSTSSQNNILTLLSPQNSSHQSTLSSNDVPSFSAHPHQYPFQY